MIENFLKVKEYLTELSLPISQENEADHYFVINDDDNGIQNMAIYVEDPIVVIEQFLFEIKKPTNEMLIDILKKNRDIIHGAMVLDGTGQKVLFRDTLQSENLDLNELEASINALSMLLSEYSEQIIAMAKA